MSPTDDQRQAPLKVMTFNILYGTSRNPAGDWPTRRALAAAVIQQWEPDVIGLQEATEAQLADLTTALPAYGVVAGPMSGPNRVPVWARTVSPILGAAWLGLLAWQRQRPQQSAERSVERKVWRALSRAMFLGAAVPVGGTLGARLISGTALDRGEHCAILYRKDRFRVTAQGAFWVSGQPWRAGSVLLGTWLPRVVNRARLERIEDGAVMTVYNTHLDYTPWAAGRSGKIMRRHMERDWDGSPQILMGDFNVTARSSMYRYLLSHDASWRGPALCDAWAEAAVKEGPKATYHAGIGRGLRRLDFILLRPRMRVARVTTVTYHEGSAYPSDHFPLMAELRGDNLATPGC